MEQMFCFQCEQTAGCKACTGKAGVCGKPADTAKVQDQLTGALIGLAQAVKGEETGADTDRLVLEGLFATITNVSFDEETLNRQIGEVERAAAAFAGVETVPYDMEKLWRDDEDIRSLKSLILFGIRGIAAYAYHALVLGYTDSEVNAFFYRALRVIGEEQPFKELLPVVMETGTVNLKCMELLDKANTKTYGTPTPVTVPLMVEKGPFIVVSGHDLLDLETLLKQTEGQGINIYTHGEMLPAHVYPKLKAYPHLKGNFGTAWQNQQKEFDGIPAPVLFTTNCLMPPKDSYRDRVFTTAVVEYPDMVHIGEEKDFTLVIQKALALGGYSENQYFTGINGGTQVTTGFGHGTVLAAAGQVVDAVNAVSMTCR